MAAGQEALGHTCRHVHLIGAGNGAVIIANDGSARKSIGQIGQHSLNGLQWVNA
jgi:hypothetical protein